MIRRKKPLKRSTKPIKRSPLRRRSKRSEVLGEHTHAYPLPTRAKPSQQATRAAERRKKDAAFQHEVCREANRRCEKCGEVRHDLGAHHVIPKTQCRGGLQHLRHDTRNGIALGWNCCHLWAEDHPAEFTEWMHKHRQYQMAWLDREKRRAVHGSGRTEESR